jgi:hypothetical protein
MVSFELSAIDMKCFNLETRLRNLEMDWPGSSQDERRRLRRERMNIRFEFELLKIDMKKLERRAEPLLKTYSE